MKWTVLITLLLGLVALAQPSPTRYSGQVTLLDGGRPPVDAGVTVALDLGGGRLCQSVGFGPTETGHFSVELAEACRDDLLSGRVRSVAVTVAGTTFAGLPVPTVAFAERTVIRAGNAATTAHGTLCGLTAPLPGRIEYDGGLVGYAAAKRYCEDLPGCGSLAHLCRFEEIGTTASLLSGAPSLRLDAGITYGLAGGSFWFAPSLPNNIYASDCDGKTVSTDFSSAYAGGPYETRGAGFRIVDAGAGRFGVVPASHPCSVTAPLACCR